MTLRICFPAIIGKDTPAITHGQKLSILFARASSSAPALYGLAKSVDGAGCDGLPGWAEEPGEFGIGCKREGERIGDEKERR